MSLPLSNIQKYLLKGATSGLGNTLVSLLSVGLLLPLIIRLIGMENYGVWSILTIFTGIASTLDFGLSRALVHLSVGKDKKAHAETRSAIFFLNISVAGTVLLIAAVCFLSGFTPFSSTSVPEEFRGHLLISGTIILVASILLAYFKAILEASYKISSVNICWAIQTMATYTLMLLAYTFTGSVIDLIYTTPAVFVSMLVIHIILARNHIHILPKGPSRATLKSIFGYSSRIFLSTVITSIVLPLNSFIFLKLDGSMETYASYNMALKISMSALSLLTAFSSPLFAHFSALGMNRLTEAWQLVRKYMVLLAAAYVLGVATFFVFGNELIALFFGKDTGLLFDTTKILITGICFYGIGEPCARAMWALGINNAALGLRIFESVTNFIFIVALFSLAPLERISYSYSLAQILGCLAFIFSFYLIYRKRRA